MRIQEFLYGIFPLSTVRLVSPQLERADFHENFITDVSLDNEAPINPDRESGTGYCFRIQIFLGRLRGLWLLVFTVTL